jgi:TetR/AcrR family transcriptional regulator, ethionamide resistance regulator
VTIHSVYTICIYNESAIVLTVPVSSPPPGPRQHGRRAAQAAETEPGPALDLRETILTATAGLLAEHSFTDLAVNDILRTAAVSRGSFYFYFDSKQAVLAELVRRAVGRGHAAAEPWLASPADPIAALRAGITAGAELWQASAPVLRAIVENWHADPRLTELWLEQMRTFTDATIAQIAADPRATQNLAGQDIAAVASALTWLGERLYYLAATGTPPFDDTDTLVGTLLHIWTSTLYATPDTSG